MVLANVVLNLHNVFVQRLFQKGEFMDMHYNMVESKQTVSHSVKPSSDVF